MDLPPDVAGWIDSEAARDRFRRSGLDVAHVVPEYVRHKPDESTIISYRFRTHAGDAERGYAHWCARPDRADEVWAKAATLKSRVTALGTANVRLDAHTVFYPFPSDARLRRMRWYTTPRKLKRTGLAELAPAAAPISESCSSVKVLRYKPERRVVAAVDLVTADATSRRVLVRYTTSRTAHHLATIATGLRGAGVMTPAPLVQLEDGRVSVDEFVEGAELRSVVHDGRAPVDGLAGALARFHGVAVAASPRSSWGDLVAVSSGLVGLASWCPSLATACEGLRRDLRRAVPDDSGPDVLLHGDLHDKNIMITGNDVVFVDLERCARGPAEVDLGRLRGVVRGLAERQPDWSPGAVAHADAVVDHYRHEARGSQVSDAALSWHTAVALVEQSLLVTRHLEADWLSTTERLLELARSEVALAGRDRPAGVR